MSDYGFATYDGTSAGRLKGNVNSKWPIFGPNYNEISKAFRTIHFTDTVQYNFKTSPTVVLPPADRNTVSEYHAYQKILVATIPHGYKKRPLGYATISGRFNKNTRGTWLYTVVDDRYNMFPPATSSPINGVGVINGGMASTADGPLRPTGGVSDYSIFGRNMFSGCNITYPSGTYWFLAGNNFSVPGNNSSDPDALGEERPPYSIEIDDTNIYLYRYYYWCDVYKRDYLQDAWDIRARMQGVIDYAGSDFDLTVYLCPYTMEDLL